MGTIKGIGKTATNITMTTGLMQVKYHNTIVFSYDRFNSTIQLDSGDWKTATTKRRINQAFEILALAGRVFQKDNQWFVEFLNDGKIIPFEDKMIILNAVI
jgi:hypothetical protein